MRFFSKSTKLSFRAAAQPNGSKLPRHNEILLMKRYLSDSQTNLRPVTKLVLLIMQIAKVLRKKSKQALMPLTKHRLKKRDTKRNIGEELLAAIVDIKAGRYGQVQHSSPPRSKSVKITG
ncbi:hypothetical protein [Pseudomonas sp. ATCC PTA-122608]|uniref:hypothetical protein n=2 Tax=Pseudomonas TaxID=286 RepID=UPI002114F47F|nr:hypothetical protein [Pseudomonas sp. ATCC PTA-122608]